LWDTACWHNGLRGGARLDPPRAPSRSTCEAVTYPRPFAELPTGVYEDIVNRFVQGEAS